MPLSAQHNWALAEQRDISASRIQKEGSSDPGVPIDMAKKAPHQEKQLPEIRCISSSEVIGKGGQTKSAGKCRHVNYVYSS